MPKSVSASVPPPGLSMESGRLVGWSEAERWMNRNSMLCNMANAHAFHARLSELDKFRFIAYQLAVQNAALIEMQASSVVQRSLFQKEKIQDDREAQGSKLHDQDPRG